MSSPIVRLIPVAERHLPEVAQLFDDPEILRFTRIPYPPRPPDFVASWFARYQDGRADGSREVFAAVPAEGPERLLGLGLVPEFDRTAGELELGYVVAPDARGQGVAGAVLRLLTDWAFAAGAIRIVLLIDSVNPGSQKVADRAGYHYEGTLRDKWLKPGIRSDTQLWSRLTSDPPALS